jgi:hypothetical protein
MPLRITLELIPRGDESQKKTLAVVDIENDGTAGDMRGNGDVGNYRVYAAGHCKGGYDDFASFTIGPLKRGDYLDTAIECMLAMHSSNLPPSGFVTGRVSCSIPGHNAKDMPPEPAPNEITSHRRAMIWTDEVMEKPPREYSDAEVIESLTETISDTGGTTLGFVRASRQLAELLLQNEKLSHEEGGKDHL